MRRVYIDDSSTGVVRRVVSPAVRREVRAHFACPDLEGADLEDDGGRGSAGSHWEARLFQGELMNAIAASEAYSERQQLTNLTLALLEDSGWCGEG